MIQKIYGIEISAGKISQITDNVLPEIEAWKTRALQSFYPIVYLDAIHFRLDMKECIAQGLLYRIQ
ncbi:MAG: transposase [Saprospiraceae bacterium]|nr:transposase [Saprospiraceae bacterium]